MTGETVQVTARDPSGGSIHVHTHNVLAWSGAAALLVAAFALLSQASAGNGESAEPTVVRATAFVLVDSNGKETATLSTNEGLPELQLLDSKGIARWKVQLLQNGSAAMFCFDALGRPTVALHSGLSGNMPTLSLADPSSDVEFLASVASGQPRLTFTDEAGEHRLSLGLGPTGSPSVALVGAGRSGRIDAQVLPDGSAVAKIRTKNGWAALVSAEGLPANLSLHGKNNEVLFDAPSPGRLGSGR